MPNIMKSDAATAKSIIWPSFLYIYVYTVYIAIYIHIIIYLKLKMRINHHDLFKKTSICLYDVKRHLKFINHWLLISKEISTVLYVLTIYVNLSKLALFLNRQFEESSTRENCVNYHPRWLQHNIKVVQ